MGCGSSSTKSVVQQSTTLINTESGNMFTASTSPERLQETNNEITDVKSGDKDKIANSEDNDKTSEILDITNDELDMDENKPAEKKKTMTPEEIAALREEKYKHLNDTVAEINTLPEIYKDGYFVVKVRNACLRFCNAYFFLKQTRAVRRQDIVSFRQGVADTLVKTKFINILCEIVIKTYETGWYNSEGKLDEKKQVPLAHSMLTLLNYSDCSDAVAEEIAVYPGFLETLKKMQIDFRDRHLKDVLEQEDQNLLTKSENKVLDHSLSIIHNISMRETNISVLRDNDFVNVTKPFLQSPKDKLRLIVVATLAGIVNEEECEIINTNQKEVKFMLNTLEKGLKDDMRRCRGWSCKELGLTVHMLARNDANQKLLADLGAFELLVELGRTGDQEEQYESVSAIWAMCFDEDNRKRVANDKELGVVELLHDLQKSENPQIKKACDGALFTLWDSLKASSVTFYKSISRELQEQKNQAKVARWSLVKNGRKRKSLPAKPPQSTSKEEANSLDSFKSSLSDEDDDVSEDDKHIFISYQWSDQETLKKVRDQIQAQGYKVWMDIDHMGGSMLQDMAEAVENAKIVLICISKKYKNSPNCRAEAEYAFQTRKQIIILKMERGYTADGWLGFICGAKLYYEFSHKYPFEEKIVALLKEIAKICAELSGKPAVEPKIKTEKAIPTQSIPPVAIDHVDSAKPHSLVTKVTVAPTTIATVRKWSTEDVQKWMEKNSLKGCLPATITGGEIALLITMRLESPEFFYKCLQEMLKVKDLLTMSKIVWALQDVHTGM